MISTVLLAILAQVPAPVQGRTWSKGGATPPYVQSIQGYDGGTPVGVAILSGGGTGGGPSDTAASAAASESDTGRQKVTAALRVLDTGQTAGSQLVEARGDQTNGIWVNCKNGCSAGSLTQLWAYVDGGAIQGWFYADGGTLAANQGTPNSAANSWPVKLTDGTNFMPTMDVAARKGFFSLTDGTNTMPTMDAAARAGFFKLTDGTNTAPTMDVAGRKGFVAWTDGTNTAAVKAASTAAAATDPSGVVALSPNSPLPAGSSTIGAVTQASGPWTSNVTQLNGTTVDTNSGNKSAGTVRVVLATDQPSMTNPQPASQNGTWTVQPGNTANTTPWLASINDGTNTAKVQAASTGPALADKALTVAQSPNVSEQCPSTLAVSQTTSTDLLTSVAKLHVCSIVLVSATAQSVSLVEGTGTVCATGTAALIGSTTAANGPALAANGGFVAVTEKPWLKSKTTADHLCLLQSGSGNLSGVITYTDQ